MINYLTFALDILRKFIYNINQGGKAMKVLAINSSARKDGNTAILIKEVFEELNQAGIETEMTQLQGQIIEPCKACWACGGALQAIDTMNHFFLNHEMYVAGSVYWNMGYGQMPGDVLKDEEALKNMHNLGQNMAFLLKALNKTETAHMSTSNKMTGRN